MDCPECNGISKQTGLCPRCGQARWKTRKKEANQRIERNWRIERKRMHALGWALDRIDAVFAEERDKHTNIARSKGIPLLWEEMEDES